MTPGANHVGSAQDVGAARKRYTEAFRSTGGALANGRAPSLFALALGDGTPKKAFVTALVVGAVLTAINHGDRILLDGIWPPPVKLLLTFVVPYCVATWGAVTAKTTHWRRARQCEEQAAHAHPEYRSGPIPSDR